MIIIHDKNAHIKDEERNLLRKWFEEEGNEPAFIDEEEYMVTCNRWFKIDGKQR